MTFFPADGQFPPAIISQFLRSMPDLDMILGYLPNRPDAALARALSLAERLLYFVVIGKMPRFQGILMFRRALLQEVTLVSSGRGWGIIMEFIARVARGPYRVRSEPTPIRPRAHGASKAMTIRDIVANTRQVVRPGRILGRH